MKIRKKERNLEKVNEDQKERKISEIENEK